MAPKQSQPAGPAMTLGNMRELGVHRLIAYCLSDALCCGLLFGNPY
jgi:hypothetical protein